MVSTMSTLISNLAGMPGANLSMLVLLAKATPDTSDLAVISYSCSSVRFYRAKNIWPQPDRHCKLGLRK